MHYFSVFIMVCMSIAAAGYGLFSLAEGRIYTAAGTIVKDVQPIGFYLNVGICFALAVVPWIFIFA